MIENAIAVVDEAPARTELDTRKPVICCDLDAATFEGKKTLFNALNSAKSLDEYRKETGASKLTVTGIILQPYESVDEATGEIESGWGTIFMTEDGPLYSRSLGITKSAQNLLGAFGGEWPVDEVVTVEFYETQLDGRRTWKEFRLV